MPCGNPVSISRFVYDPFHGGRIRRYFLVPCGKCVACLRTRQQQYAFRAEWEALDPSNVQVLFCTFTYSDEYLPLDNELSKLEVQRFIRRLRLYCPGVRVRYFFCGEHGEQFDRAHYHAILYFDTYVGFEPILKAWPFGIVDIAPFLPARAGYVAKYSVKQLGDDSSYRQEPFLLLSNSLGQYFLQKHGDFIRKNYIAVWYNLSGYPVVIPRYYIDKLFPPDNSIDRDKEFSYPVYASARSFLGKRTVFRAVKRAAYDSTVKVQSRLAGYSDPEAYKYDVQRGVSFRCFNLANSVLNRVAYETGRY